MWFFIAPGAATRNSLLFAIPTKELPSIQSGVLILGVLGHRSPFVLLCGCTGSLIGGFIYAACEVQAALQNLVSCNIPGGTGRSENSSNKHPHHSCEVEGVRRRFSFRVSHLGLWAGNWSEQVTSLGRLRFHWHLQDEQTGRNLWSFFLAESPASPRWWCLRRRIVCGHLQFSVWYLIFQGQAVSRAMWIPVTSQGPLPVSHQTVEHRV